MKRIIGFENSNSSIKGVSNLKSIYYPNTIRRVRSVNSLNRSLGGSKIYEVDGAMYQVGFDNGYGSGSKDESRYYSEQFKIESAIAFSQMCNHGDRLQVVTGLPANLASREDIVLKLKETLVGSYRVKCEGQIKQFVVESVMVASQPVGTLWSILFKPDGSLKVPRDVFTKEFLIIDIGYGTTDIVVLSATKGIDDSQTRTFDIAMSDYVNSLYKAIEQQIPESRLTQAKISPYQLDRLLADSDKLDIQTGVFDVRKIKEELQLSFTEELKMRLDNFGYTLDQYHEVILTGGGSANLHKAIKQVFGNNPKIRLVDDPILANVKGFAIMAVQQYGE